MKRTVASNVPLNNTKINTEKENSVLQYDFSWFETTLECGRVHP